MTYHGIEVAGSEVIYRNGCLERTRYWLRGWHSHFPQWATYIHGYSGPETVITVDHIIPSCSLEVIPA